MKKTLLLLAICMTSLASMAANLTTTWYKIYEHTDQYQRGNGSSANVTRIDITWLNGDINVEYGDVDKVTWEESVVRGTADEHFQVHYWNHNGTLHLYFAQSGKWQMDRNLQKDLKVILPKKFQYAEVEIENVDGDIHVRAQTLKLELETVNGDINANVKAKEVSAESVNGNITITNRDAREIDMESVNGNLTLYLPSTSSFTAEVSKINGTFTTDFTCTQNKHIYSTGGQTAIDIDIECINGNISILKVYK